MVALFENLFNILNSIIPIRNIGDRYMRYILQDVPIGRNIQTVRLSRGMTQEQVVQQMQLHGSSISRSTLANIERGSRNIKVSDLKILKEIFNVEYEAFFES